jgi:hypothetical protein
MNPSPEFVYNLIIYYFEFVSDFVLRISYFKQKNAHTNMLNKKHTYMDDLSTYFTM